ncbi:MAG TPA: hypothetical protein VHR45_17525 [Thermoanaerobaculia bacterium]|nr:hypothetical protein [Thermoanaerobaculia bacterium]
MSQAKKKPARGANVTIRISPEEREAWAAAAAAEDRGLSSWLRWVANREAALIRGARPGRS